MSSQPAEPRDAPRAGPSRSCLWASLAASFLALSAAFWTWALIDLEPALVFMPLHWVVAPAILFAVTLWAMAVAFGVKRRGRGALAPLAVCVVAWILLATLPWLRLWLAFDFAWKLSERERIVEDIRRGVLGPNVDYNGAMVALGRSYAHVSAGDNEVVLERRPEGPWVLFFTFRGVLNHYSGFLYVPEGGNPETFSDLSDRRHQVVPYGHGWYWVAR